MIAGWQTRGDYWTRTNSPGFVREPRSRGYSGTRRPASSGLKGVKKNKLRPLRDGSSKFLRPQGSAYPGPTLRRDADLPGGSDQACSVLQVQEGEAREASLAVRQPFLHKALCLLCGKTVPEDDRSRCIQRAEAFLAYDQGAGKAIHERTASAYGYSWSRGNRYR